MSNNPSRPDRSRDLALIGTTIAGKYRVQQLLGQGGFGTVFLVEIISGMVGEKLALKLIPAELCRDEKSKSRFLNEIRVAMRMVNKYIVQVRDVGETEAGQLYYTMDYCPGETLAEVLKREGKMSPARTIPHVLRILEALKTAHLAGVIHRDLKPANVMVFTQDQHETCRVLDFGIATAIGRGKPGGEGFLGSPHYMPPEQFLNEELGVYTDTYSVGVILYECLTGQKPYRGKTAQEVYNDIKKRPVVPPDQINPELKSFPGVSRVISRALERNPELRYQTAKDMFADLKAVLEGKAEPPPPPPPAAPAVRRRKAAVVAGRVAPAPRNSSSGVAIGLAAGLGLLALVLVIILKGSGEKPGPGAGGPAVPTAAAPAGAGGGTEKAGSEPKAPAVEYIRQEGGAEPEPKAETVRKESPEDLEAKKREDAEKAKTLIVEAAKAAKEGNWEKALELSNDALDRYGYEGPEASRIKGIAELRQGLFEAARKSLAEARNRTPREKVDLELVLHIIDAYAGDPAPDLPAIGRLLDDAMEIWRRSPEKDPAGTLRLLATVEAHGDEEMVLAVLEEARKAKIDDPAVAKIEKKYLVDLPRQRQERAQESLKVARAALVAGDFAAAVTRAEEGFGLTPIPELGFVLAEAYQGLGKRKEMQAALGETAKAVKDDAEGLLRVGLLYGRMFLADYDAGGRKEAAVLTKALANLDAAVEILGREPKGKFPQLLAPVRSERARCHALSGKADKVEEDLGIARSAPVKESALYLHQAETFLILAEKVGEPDRGSALKGAIARLMSYKDTKEGAKDAKGFKLLGVCYLRQGAWNKAVTSFDKAEKLGLANDPDLLESWAEAFKGSGDPMRAGQKYRSSFELRPTEEACVNAAKSFIEANNRISAENILQQGREKFPGSTKIRNLLESVRR